MVEKVLMPKLGLTMTEGIVNEWFKKEGDAVKKGDTLCSISSEKLSHDVESESDGFLLKIITPAGETALCKHEIALVGQLNEKVSETTGSSIPAANNDSAQESPIKATKAVAPTKSQSTDNKRVFISKLARKMILEGGIDAQQIVGTGGNGRITRRDVEKYLATMPQNKGESQRAPTNVGEGLSGMRRAIASNMMHSLHTTAQLTLQRKVNISQLMQFRTDIKAKLADTTCNSSFSLNIFLLKAVALGLKDVPELNSNYDGKNYQKFEDVNIGIAVSLDNGLVVPVVNNVTAKTLTQLEKEFKALVQDVRNGDFSSAKNGTFTISNLGSEGIEYFTPIINTPEVGILGVGSLSERLCFDENKEIKVIKELPLSLTFDHQIIDGEPAAKFLTAVSNYLENPYLLIV